IGWLSGYGEVSEEYWPFGVYRTINQGGEWNLYAADSEFYNPEQINSIFFLDERTGWMVGTSSSGSDNYANIILKFTTDEGWERIPSGNNLPLNKITFINHDIGWISGGYNNFDGYRAVFLRTENGGTTWTSISGLDYLVNDFCFENRDHGWAVGENMDGKGIILESFNGGLAWEIVTDTLPARLNNLHLKNDIGLAVGDDGLTVKLEYTSKPEPKHSINKFMVVGDLHHYSPSPDMTRSMLYEFALEAIKEEVDFLFIPGDLVIRGANDPTESDSLLQDWRFILDTLYQNDIRLYACRGNNDAGSGPTWDSLFSGIYQFPQNGPDDEINHTYAIETDSLLFVALDEYTDRHKVNQVWLDGILKSAEQEHIFVTGHEPAFQIYKTDCLGAFPEERNIFWESLANAGVKTYFSGHAHFYDHTLIDDDDGEPENNVHQVVVGTGGGYLHPDAEYIGDNGTWTPQREYHEEAFGYVLVELNGDDALMTWRHRLGPGQYEHSGDSCNFKYEAMDTLGIGPDKAASDFDRILYYPNPVYNILNIESTYPANLQLEITSLNGTVILNEEMEGSIHQVDLSAYRKGVYFISIRSKDFVITRKIIKL
ncbi:MAG: T9SS type A sorting domain-containing protein, partial [Bacteroidales bacterium]